MPLKLCFNWIQICQIHYRFESPNVRKWQNLINLLISSLTFPETVIQNAEKNLFQVLLFFKFTLTQSFFFHYMTCIIKHASTSLKIKKKCHLLNRPSTNAIKQICSTVWMVTWPIIASFWVLDQIQDEDNKPRRWSRRIKIKIRKRWHK